MIQLVVASAFWVENCRKLVQKPFNCEKNAIILPRLFTFVAQLPLFMRSLLKYYYRKYYQKLHYDTFKTLILLGRLHAENNRRKEKISSLAEVEFQVFSQRGEDGILHYIIDKIDIPNKIFIEFGVEDYTESNTRFLLVNDNWAGLVIDGSADNVRFIREDFIYWKYDITDRKSVV